MFKQRDGPKLFLPSMGVVATFRGDKHDHSEKERQHRHGEFGRVHNCGAVQSPSKQSRKQLCFSRARCPHDLGSAANTF
jgi:hypothetical protein